MIAANCRKVFFIVFTPAAETISSMSSNSFSKPDDAQDECQGVALNFIEAMKRIFAGLRRKGMGMAIMRRAG
jgi:hypothetical protein